MNIKIDNEFKNLIPKLTTEEYEQLEKNILDEGIRESIIVWQGVIIDGHNRYEIAQKHGLEFNTLEKEFGSRDDVVEWIINNQLGRRNITPEQKDYLIGLKYRNEKNKETFKGNQYTKSGKDQNDLNQNTAQKIAKQYNISEPTVKRAEKYADGVDNISKVKPEFKDELFQGKSELTKEEISSFANIDNKQNEEIIQKEIEKRLAEIEKEKNEKKEKKQKQLEEAKKRILEETKSNISENKPKVYNMNCVEFLNKMDNCDLLLTDPPYSTDVDNISEFVDIWLYTALNKVKDTGRAYIFIGAYPEEVKAYLNAKIPKHLKLEQILVWTYKNTLGNNPKDRYKLNYQSCLYFKGVNAPDLDCPITNEQWAVQEINAPDGRLGDRYHSWQKPTEIAERFIRHSTKKGDIVLDPFVCTGTFIISANKLGRNGFGCDISKENLKIAIERGCEYGS